jgi:uncharacterized membrane protein
MKMLADAPTATGGVFYPSTPNEFITLFAHFHRAEIARMAGWRDRIDRTTYWAITVAAAMLSVSLSTPTAHHSVLLFGMLLTFLMLMIEARRYRFFDVYRSRVRKLERNYYAKLFSPELSLEDGWQLALSDDLRLPTFTMTTAQSISRRMRRNYVWIFLILLAAWTVKITFPKLELTAGEIGYVARLHDMIQSADVGPVPGWAVILVVSLFYCWVLSAYFTNHWHGGELAHGNVHV